MKKGIKIIIYFVGIIVILAAVFYLSLFYVTNCKKIDCDVSVSPNQNYRVDASANRRAGLGHLDR